MAHRFGSRRLLVILLLFVACGRETRDESARTMTLPSSPPPARTSTRAQPPPVATRAAATSTPQRCAGDGSYEQALDCFHISAGFRFVLTDKDGFRAEGTMTRPTPGLERVELTADGAKWVGEAKKAGVVWSRNGAHQQSPPEFTNRVWQRTTMVLDPQKKEGKAQLAGEETIGGEDCNHVHFTNANNGDANDVWVSRRDGHVVKWSAGASTLEIR
jgi:hypothetical protein